MVIADKLSYAGNLRNLGDILDSPNHIFLRHDITDQQAMDEDFSAYRPALVVNFAAESHVDRSILDSTPFVGTNVLGAQVLLDCMRRYEVDRFLQVSTDEVYGSAPQGVRFDEDSLLQPSSPYAASKAAADLLCLAYHHTFGAPILITRSSNNYGPYQFPEKLIPLSILTLLRGESIPVYGDGSNSRDWLYVTDNCAALLSVLERGKPGQVYNVGRGEELQNLQLVDMLCELFSGSTGQYRNGATVSYRFVEDRPGHDQRYALATDKIRRDTGWEASISFEEGLHRTLDWYLGNRDWVDEVLTGDYTHYYEAVYKRSWGRL